MQKNMDNISKGGGGCMKYFLQLCDDYVIMSASMMLHWNQHPLNVNENQVFLHLFPAK